MNETATTEFSQAAQAFALAAVLGDGAASSDLIRHLPLSIAAEADKEIKTLLALSDTERGAIIKTKLHELGRKSHPVSLGAIHPGWILEALKEEGPLVRGLALRYLPAEAVAMILSQMDSVERELLPSIKYAFRVAPEVVEFVKSKLEQKIGVTEPALESLSSQGGTAVAPLFCWDYRRLSTALPELGLELLALALRGTQSDRVRFFLKRLSMEDAKRLKNRIRVHRDVESNLTQSALIHVLSLDLIANETDEIFPEVGLSLLALSFRNAELKLARIFAKRLEPKLGYLFLRYVQGSRDLSLSDGSRLAGYVIERFKS